MKITNCHIERTYNLGNYESLKVGFEAALNETDKPLEVSADLEILCHQHFENHNKPKPQTPKTEAPRPQTPAPPKQLTQTKPDSTVCPRCGSKKKPEYDVCYTCHMDDVEADKQ
jgi:hypothetical protein